MKRLWLEWDGDKATGVWDGRIWDVELEEGFAEAFLWGINLKAGNETIRLIASSGDKDLDHGNHPQWIDCWRAVGADDLDDAMTHAGQAVAHDVAELFRTEIREHGFMRHIFPPDYIETAGTGEERARRMVELTAPTREELVGNLRRSMSRVGDRGFDINVQEVDDRLIASVDEVTTAIPSQAQEITEEDARRILERARDLYMNAPDNDIYPRLWMPMPSTTGGI